MTLKVHRALRLSLLILAIAAVGIILPHIFTGYYLAILNLIIIYYIACMGLNIASGETGLVSLATAGLMCVGAYTSAIWVRLGVPFCLALPLAGTLGAVVGFSLGYPALRLGGLSLALATIGFTQVVQQVAMQWTSMTGGTIGMTVLRPTLVGIELNDDRSYFYLTFLVAVILIVAAINLLKGKTGRAFRGIRGSEVAAQLMGIKLATYKTMAFSVCGFYAAIAGSLYAHFAGRISPEIFGLWLSVSFMAMIIIGGMGSTILGSIIGAVFYVTLPEAFRITREIQAVIFGLAVVVSLIHMPAGIAGALQSLMAKLKVKVKSLSSGKT